MHHPSLYYLNYLFNQYNIKNVELSGIKIKKNCKILFFKCIYYFKSRDKLERTFRKEKKVPNIEAP